MRYVRVKLSGEYSEIGPQVGGLRGMSSGPHFRMDYFSEQVFRVCRKKKISTVLIVRDDSFSVSNFAALESIRNQLLILKNSGKRLIYSASNYSMQDCYLSSVCQEKAIDPLGAIRFLGMSVTGKFFQGLLEKQNIKADIIRRGRYKSAGDPFRSKEYDEFNREQLARLLEGAVTELQNTVRDSGFMTEEQIQNLLNGTSLTASQAAEQKLVQHVSTSADLEDMLKEDKIKSAKLPKVKSRYGRGKRIAVLVFEGAIMDGKNQQHPLLGQIIGSDTFIKEIRSLRENKKIKAVVLRINSGGGSATASDAIVRELERLNKEKPLVISMGQIAGSGGYWIATCGRKLFAQNTTITGSIGVINLHFELQSFLKKFGISTDVIRAGKFADIGSSLRPMTEEEHAFYENEIERIYQLFLKRCADFRKTDTNTIHNVGEGRVWLGSDAKTNGLIDDIGDLYSAVSHAADLIDCHRYSIQYGPHIKQPWILRNIGKNNAAVYTGLNAMDKNVYSGVSMNADFAVRTAKELAAISGKVLALDPMLMQLH
ncbi:signal peptide peptidase SppA [Spirochaeta dissipatitropha]